MCVYTHRVVFRVQVQGTRVYNVEGLGFRVWALRLWLYYTSILYFRISILHFVLESNIHFIILTLKTIQICFVFVFFGIQSIIGHVSYFIKKLVHLTPKSTYQLNSIQFKHLTTPKPKSIQPIRQHTTKGLFGELGRNGT